SPATYIARQSYLKGLGEPVHPNWEDLQDWQRDEFTERVHLVLTGVTPAISHTNWLSLKSKLGWVYGPRLNSEKKQHPDLVPYDRLPMRRLVEDEFFLTVVREMEKPFAVVILP